MKKIILVFLTFFLSISLSLANESLIIQSETGVIKEVEFVEMNSDIAQAKQVLDIVLTSGEYKNKAIKTENILSGNPLYDIKLKKGMKVILHIEQDEDELIFSIADVQRFPVLILLSIIFGGLLIFVGRKKGINSLVAIAITCALIVYLLTPLILIGFNPIIATIIICLLATTITMYFVGGFNRKSTAAILGCIASLIIAGMLSIITVKIAHLTGFSNEQSLYLYSAHPELNFISILVSTMIIATMGAVMDVAMSIASTINEIYTVDSSKTVKELFISGMNVGRDIIGTMANTLILVYLGASLPLLLLANNIDLQKFLNLNQVVTEISSALIGSCAIILCVPITAIIASELIKKMPQKFDFPTLKD